MADIMVIDYGAGNLHSVCAGFRRVMQPSDTLTLTNRPQDLAKATHIVLPGVGAFKDCIHALQDCTGMIDALEKEVMISQRPFLGICVGMQMLLETGLEHGRHMGLGWIKGEVIPIPQQNETIRIPHMGWNDLLLTQKHSATAQLSSGDDAYFVHSYYASLTHPASDMLAYVDYGVAVPAIIARENIIGTQFHPEKSQKVGATVLENFLKME